jgi:hypothetical membrane protein
VAKIFRVTVADFQKVWQSFFPDAKSKAIAFLTLILPAFFKRWNIHTALAIAGIIGPLMFTVGDLTAALSTSNYSLVHNSISSLALTRIGFLQTIGFLALGLLIEIFTAGLLFNMKRARLFHLGIAILVFFGFAMLLIGAFRTDPAGTTDAARTIEGRIHGLTAQTAFTLFPFAILFLLPSIRRDPGWKNLFRYTQVTFVLALVLIVIIKVFKEPNSLFGLMERLLVANMILWVEVAAVNLFILSIKRGKKALGLSLDA